MKFNFLELFNKKRSVLVKGVGISDFFQNDGSYSPDPQAGLMMM